MKQETSTLNVPKFPLASRNHKISKEQMIGEQQSLKPVGQVCTWRQRFSETEAQGKKRVSLGHAAQTPSTAARHPVQFFLHYIAMLWIGNYFFFLSPLSFPHETSLEFFTVTGTISVCLSLRSCLSNKSPGNVTGCSHAIRSATRFCWMCMVMMWHF